MAASKIVKIRKTEGGETFDGECVESAYPLWRDKGWTLVEEKAATPAKSSSRAGGSRSRGGKTPRQRAPRRPSGDSAASASVKED
jgi:hypothetical protein